LRKRTVCRGYAHCQKADNCDSGSLADPLH
jgi:hypothetical protein